MFHNILAPLSRIKSKAEKKNKKIKKIKNQKTQYQNI